MFRGIQGEVKLLKLPWKPMIKNMLKNNQKKLKKKMIQKWEIQR